MATVLETTAFLVRGPFRVCQACRGMYNDQELLEKCKEVESDFPNSKPGRTQTKGEQAPVPVVNEIPPCNAT